MTRTAPLPLPHCVKKWRFLKTPVAACPNKTKH